MVSPAPPLHPPRQGRVRGYVVVSGLPGSGKSTLARGLAARLGLAVIDKDVLLESLYDSLGVRPEPWRHRLSRAADDLLYAQAALAPGAVLDNWWHPDTAPAPLHRLRGPHGRLVQVHCDCDVAVAAARFQARRRHPGHLDPVHTPEQVAERVAAVRASYRGPLDLDVPLLRVDTGGGGAPVDVEALAARVGGLLGAGVRPESPPAP
ncbi:AAA family ATPase [Actinacidiphila paucisporea]|uniref:Shikimate kinase n=1 Tax=Actinacidiphila paucisporea TaxID=310782 RepID=A0A1M7PBJ0_9ACTN|nr:AAA family ATPase [Actinacidiphila paucisporea]SHN14171.1 shikimate kinase [Actinacidiphila paucisporea]